MKLMCPAALFLLAVTERAVHEFDDHEQGKDDRCYLPGIIYPKANLSAELFII
jgi:hypothetical protein